MKLVGNFVEQGVEPDQSDLIDFVLVPQRLLVDLLDEELDRRG